MIDKSAPFTQEKFNVFHILMKLGLICTQREPDKRPEMVPVFKELQQFNNLFNSTQ